MTGASGTLGEAMAKALASRGWRIRALEHRRSVQDAHETVQGDLADPGSLHRALEGTQAVLHLAAITHARRDRLYERVNVEGTRLLLNAARDAMTGRFLHVSTRAISEQGGGYSRSKRAAERLVREAGMDTVIVRLPEVYGAGGNEGLDVIITRARAARPIPVAGSGEHEICPAHVQDVAAATAAALELPVASGRTYTLAGQCMTVREFADHCVTALGSSSRVRPVPLLALKVAGLAAHVLPVPLYPDQLARLRAAKAPASPEARTDLGFSPRPLAVGLETA